MQPAAPHTIGRYEVERLLGQGGMGRVWLARDTVLGRRVAIKVLRDDLALAPTVRDELVARMRHEAQAAASVSHPNIVTLHDMGEDDGVGLFLVFEYVQGPRADEPESLRDRLRAGPLPLGEVATLARELGSALTFAHAAGVVHRDIKPENILYSRTGAKIADFGIARIPDSTITRVNTVLGTPAYTAPEALSDGEFGPASDQFAFAATLYEAATGVRAFDGEDPIVTAGKVSSEPPPPLEATLGASPAVRSLASALGKGLAKAVDGRFASCGDLGQAVGRAIERPPEGGALIDVIPQAPPVARIEVDDTMRTPFLERTPLGSRLALERAARMSDHPVLTPYGDTQGRPSVIIRDKRHRFQNVMAAAALVVIVVLIVMGKKRNEGEPSDAAEGGAAPSAHSTSGATAGATPPANKRAARPHASPSAATSASSSAADSGSASSEAVDAGAPRPRAAVTPPVDE